MAANPTYPGVYVQEVSSGVRTIVGVSTSVALFIGYTKSGPLDKPTRCFSYTDYLRAYGDDNTGGDMNRHVKLAFLNGLTEAYVLRVASGADAATVDLTNGSGTVLTLVARDPGVAGDNIRATVTYSGNNPESSFNLSLWRWVAQPNGAVVAQELESWMGLSMDPASGSYAPTFISSNSKLVEAAAGPAAAAGTAVSILMRPVVVAGTIQADWNANFATKTLSISVQGKRYVTVTLPAFDTDEAGTASAVEAAVMDAYAAELIAAPTGFSVQFLAATGGRYLSLECTDGDVLIRPGADSGAQTLYAGAAQGGLEVGRFAAARPAPTGLTCSPLQNVVVGGVQHDLARLAALRGAGTVTVTLDTFDAAGAVGTISVAVTFTATDVQGRLAELRDEINALAAAAPPGQVCPWTAEVWGVRLAVVPTDGTVPRGADDNRRAGSFSLVDDALPAWVPRVTDNVRFYSVGASGASTPFQAPGAGGIDGDPPADTTAYEAAFDVVRREVDLFNLLLLPRANPSRDVVDSAWGIASVFAQERRALLLMEPPEDWSGVADPANDVSGLRVGLSKQYAALYYPRLLIREGALTLPLSPVGAVAGIMARTDNARGVWKAPAGLEADVRGISGVEQRLSDLENGALNPKGVNVVRALPSGVVVWGARTMDGYDEAASEYKYVPVRRLSNFMAESLYRGLQWVVFEPNDEPLWAQIRLNVGAFMHDLFRKGAFQGTKPSDAYFVKCDRETTTTTDQNLGIVNIWVGFAPLKPAEFVILTIEQMAGQSAV